MNIFAVNKDPVIAAQSLCDKHVIKMIVETTQLLSTAINEKLACQQDNLYKTTHKNHPCNKWARQSQQNFKWLYEHGIELLNEYYFRYNKKHHKSSIVLLATEKYKNIFPDAGLTNFAQAMPENYRSHDPIISYRMYYRREKKKLLFYTKRKPPIWLLDLAIIKN